MENSSVFMYRADRVGCIIYFYFVASKGLATFLLIRSMYLIFCLVQIGIQAKSEQMGNQW